MDHRRQTGDEGEPVSRNRATFVHGVLSKRFVVEQCLPDAGRLSGFIHASCTSAIDRPGSD